MNANIIWALQYTDCGLSQEEVTSWLTGLAQQVDYLGGRVLAPSAQKPGWRVQAFFQDAPDSQWLPDGLRRVCILKSQAGALSIQANIIWGD